jgi:hypothetical protein
VARRELPFDDGWEKFGDEALVVGSDGVDVDGLVGLGVEVERVEYADGGEVLVVLRVHEMGVCALAVPPVAESRVRSQVRGSRGRGKKREGGGTHG